MQEMVVKEELLVCKAVCEVVFTVSLKTRITLVAIFEQRLTGSFVAGIASFHAANGVFMKKKRFIVPCNL